MLNSLCALALGFLLDMCLGNKGGKFSSAGIIRTLIYKITKFLKGAYADSAAAQGAAGGVLLFFTLFIVTGISLLILLAAYKIHVVLGIICEGLMCKSALNIRNFRIEAVGIFRTVKNGSEELAAKRVKKLSGKETENMTMDEIASMGIETIAKRTNEFAVAPIFYIFFLGGLGAMIYETVFLLDEFAGHKTKHFRMYGKASARMKDVFDFIPSKICSLIIIFDCYFLKLNGKNAIKVYKRDRKKAFAPAQGHMISAMAGGLGIALYSPEYEENPDADNPEDFSEMTIRDKNTIGTALKEIIPQDIYWAIQLFCGTAAYSVILAALLKTVISIIL